MEVFHYTDDRTISLPLIEFFTDGLFGRGITEHLDRRLIQDHGMRRVRTEGPVKCPAGDDLYFELRDIVKIHEIKIQVGDLHFSSDVFNLRIRTRIPAPWDTARHGGRYYARES